MNAPWIFIWIFSYLWILMKHHSSASLWNGTKFDFRTKSGSPTNLLKTETRGNASSPGQISRKEPRKLNVLLHSVDEDLGNDSIHSSNTSRTLGNVLTNLDDVATKKDPRAIDNTTDSRKTLGTEPPNLDASVYPGIVATQKEPRVVDNTTDSGKTLSKVPPNLDTSVYPGIVATQKEPRVVDNTTDSSKTLGKNPTNLDDVTTQKEPRTVDNTTYPRQDPKNITEYPDKTSHWKLKYIVESRITAPDQLKEDDKAVCEPTRSSCENLCGVEETRWNTLLCSCDVYCLIYDTCCEDFKQFCPETWQESNTMFPHLMNLQTQCLTQSPVSYLVIASCSDSLNRPLSDQIRRDCEDAMAENPVSIGHFHFKNIHCLRCNGLNETEAIVWTLHINLQSEYKHIWTTGPKFIADFKSLEVSQAWMLPTALPPTPIPKLCRASIIDSCPVGTELELKKKCERAKSYVLPGPGHGVTIYSNKYCLVCNHDNETGCRSALISDFEPDSHSGPVTLARWTPFNSGEKGGVVISTVKMLWRTIECRGDYTDRPALNCTVRDCYDFILLVDGVCSVDNLKVCHWLEINLWNVTAKDVDGTKNTEATLAGLVLTVKDILEWYIHKAYQYPKWSYDIMGASIKFQIDTIRGGEEISGGAEHTRIGQYVTRNLSEKGYVGELSVCFDTKECRIQRKVCENVETYEIPQLSHMASGYYRNTRASWYLLVLYLLKLTIG